MAKVWGVVQDSQGNVIDAVEIKTYLAGTSTLATIYSDAAMTIPIDQVASPVQSDTNGHWQFFTATSPIKIAGTKGTLTFTEDNLSVIGILEHGGLTGLADDDHPQYALLAGRSGGQALVGGTGAGETAAISGNSVDGASLTVHVSGVDVQGASGTTVLRVYDPGVNSSAILRLQNDAQSWDVRTDPGDSWVVRDQSAATEPVKVEPSAPDRSIYVDASGNIGLGTIPSQPLHALSASSFTALFEGALSSSFLLKDTGAGADLKIFQVLNDSGLLRMRALTDAFGLKATGINLVASTGYVGVNTITPAGALDVNGAIYSAGGGIFNVKSATYGAVGDGVTNDATAIQSAINAANAAKGGIVFFPTGIYRINSTLTLKPGVVLQGVAPGVWPSSYGNYGSTIQAGANLTNMIATDLANAEQGMGIRDLLVDGKTGTYTVTTAVNLFGRSIKLENVHVTKASGNGVHFQPTSGAEIAWVNWMDRCHISFCGGVGCVVECTDSWFTRNYFTNNNTNIHQQSNGGNAWIGNHIDNATTAGMKIQSVLGANQMGSQIVGNYFDVNDNAASTPAILFTSHDGSTRWEWHFTVEGNVFRANAVDIRIEDAIKVSVNGSEHYPGGATVNGIVFDNCDGGVLSNVHWNSTGYTAFFSGLPANVSLRACYQYESAGTEQRSESSGTATITSGTTSVTVTHKLLGTPHAVVVTGEATTANAYVSNIGATTFDINLSIAPGSDKTVHWIAWYTL